VFFLVHGFNMKNSFAFNTKIQSHKERNTLKMIEHLLDINELLFR